MYQFEKPAKDSEVIVMKTNMGTIKMRLFPEKAPKTVENFVTHAKEGYYDGLTFHRVINGFMIQQVLPPTAASSSSYRQTTATRVCFLR